jgi:hypothetical protein
MNTWNTLPQSYHQRVNNNTVAIDKSQIQPAENRIPAVDVRTDPAQGDNAILVDYLTSEVASQACEIGRTDTNIRIDNNGTDDDQDFGMPGGSGNFADEGDESD